MQRPLMIFIVGTTAVGKTKLSIQLCKAIGGQVINCDSKQLYKHANIMTAKADMQQRQGIPHHMLDILQLNENCYNRNKYFTETMKCIENIKSRGKVPVIVGGTNYYLQTLLYDINMNDNNQNNQQSEENKLQIIKKVQDDKNQYNQKQKQLKQKQLKQLRQSMSKMTRQQKYEYLKKVDPIMAQKLHRNDQTRITSFLTRYSQSGIAPSLTYKPQIHKLRNTDTILFWIRNQNKKQLHKLMQNRIDKMANGGGLVETLTIFKYADMHGLLEGMKMGALQSIGYKQFKQAYDEIKDILQSEQFDSQIKSYEQIQKLVLTHIDAIKNRLMNKNVKSTKFNNKNVSLFEKCKQVLTKNTIDYSKRQITWIRNRLFGSQQNHGNFFVLDIGNQSQQGKDLMTRFQLNVKNRSLEILNVVKAHGIGHIYENGKQFNINKHEGINQWKKYYCDQCKIQANGSHQWRQHLFSRKHKQSQSKKQRMQKIKEQKEKYAKLQNKKSEKQQQENNINQEVQYQNSQSSQGLEREQPTKKQKQNP